ncbi:MAG: iron ABC transporter permease [Clostridia bacterium]|nr:iron ABC transporter permease [Clostridia bacterium]
MSEKCDRRLCGVFAAVLLLLAVLLVLSVCVGAYPLTVADAVTALCEMFLPRDVQAMPTRVFWSLRVPRTATALLSGTVLGLCGAIYQLVFRSPLASPDLTGIASGASFGAALAIVLGVGSSAARMGFAFLGGLLSLVLVLLLVSAAGGERIGTYILSGIVISAVADAGLMILKTLADPERQLAAIDFWTMGSLAAVSAEKAIPLFAVALPAVILLLLFHRPVTMLSLGGDECRAMGLSPNVWRALLLSLATLAVSASVSVTGTIGFVGLTAPHIARLLIRRRGGAYLFLSACLGGVILTAADLAARTVGGGAELPISIFTVAAGVPVLVVLLCAEGRRRQTWS